MAIHDIKKKIVLVEGVEFLKITSTYITLTPKEDLEEIKVKEDNEKVKDDKKIKDIEDDLSLFKKIK